MESNIRKIGRIGYTRILSLPKFWLAVVKLDAGDHVELTIGKHNELIIKPYRGKIDEEKGTLED